MFLIGSKKVEIFENEQQYNSYTSIIPKIQRTVLILVELYIYELIVIYFDFRTWKKPKNL